MSVRRRSIAATVCGASVLGLVLSATSVASAHDRSPVKHVLLLSVDGLHQSDLAAYVSTHPHSALAALVAGGTEYTHAQTTFPSDSFPGMVAQFTGGGRRHHRRLLRRHLQPRVAAAGHRRLRARPHRAPRCPGPRPPTARRTRSPWTPGQKLTAPGADERCRPTPWRRRWPNSAAITAGDPEDDADPAVAARPGRAAGRPGDLHAGLPAQLPPGEHRLRGRPRARPAHRLVGQARRPTRSSTGRPAPASRTCSRRRSTASPTPPATTGRPTTR